LALFIFFLVGYLFLYVYLIVLHILFRFIQIFLASCIIKILRNRESNIQEFSIERLLEDDNDEDDPLIQ
jgi:hypothetical protein